MLSRVEERLYCHKNTGLLTVDLLLWMSYQKLGSNTVANWLKKYGNLRPKDTLNPEVMSKPHSPIEEKNRRKKRYDRY